MANESTTPEIDEKSFNEFFKLNEEPVIPDPVIPDPVIPDPDVTTDPVVVPDPAIQKQTQAFAEMRIANKQKDDLIAGIAASLGIQTKDPAQLLEAVKAATIKAQAKQQNVPEELLSRLSELEQVNQTYTEQQALIAAGQGFQAIKTQYGLTDVDLDTFAGQLIADGINPYQKPVDLVSEYRLRNYDAIMKNQFDKGKQQEAERASKAGAQSSTPSGTAGAGDPAGETPINTIAGLTKYLEENSK